LSRFKEHPQLSEEDEENVLFILKVFLKLSTLCILTIIHFFLFQINAHDMLNTCIYYQLPSTCFGVCLLHHLQGDCCAICSEPISSGIPMHCCW